MKPCRFRWSLIALVALPAAVSAQTQDSVDERFQAPDLPTPNVYRSASGKPGPQYWQQRADYSIRASLDPLTNTLSGSETIAYTNNSPDTLTFVWIQLDQNLFHPESKGAQTFPADSRVGSDGFEGGLTIERLEEAGLPLEKRIDDTMMRVDLSKPLPPKGSTTFEIDFSFRVPKTGADRMGHDGDHYLMAQWYPRMAVYDDVNGWNTLPYLGQGEFYLEYGDFEVALTVPATFFVGATGTLENPEEVLTEVQISRLANAQDGGAIVNVVTAAELADPAAIRPATAGTLTWRFAAENVRDFVWVASPRILWDATRYKNTLIHAIYRPDALAWTEAAEITRHSLEWYSEYLGEYPYPTATAVEGPVFGMEYPMVVFVAPEAEREDLFDVLDHEWGHMWFPMIVGSDERRYAWMDEGIDTFINQGSKLAYLPNSEPELFNVAQYATAIQVLPEQRVGDRPDLFGDQNLLGVAAYIKPAVMFNALRAIAGPEVFDAALRRYFEVWSYKHPQPADLYRLLENEMGMDLSWFVHNWVHTTGYSDMAILGVDQNKVDDRWMVRVSVDQRGDLLMPARIVATTATGVTNEVTIPAEAFFDSDRATATLFLPERAERIGVNDGPAWGDIVPQNNVWER